VWWVFFFVWVGSLDKIGRRYCSRVCCPAALKNAFKIREHNPAARILILYRDLMTPGFLEEHYTRARREGILFASYELDARPRVALEEGKLRVTFIDPVLRQEARVTADLVCLGTGIEPEPGNARLAEVLGVPLNEDGFFQEAESKWRPVDFLKEGLFVAGLAHSPRPLVEALTQAEAAAQRAFTYLSRRQILTAQTVSHVHASICSRCRICVTACPFEARAYDEVDGRIVVDEAACQGCGMCAAACPNGAAEMGGNNQRQALALIEASLRTHAWPR
jgi:heterodisulfide reductase subunit A